MSNIYYDGNKYYTFDKNGDKVPVSSNRNTAVKKTDNLVRKSTSGQRTNAKPRTVRVYADRLKVAVTTLAILCTVGGALLTSGAMKVYQNFQDNQIIHEAVMEFRRNAITDNTKRTQNNKYYYYEYDDINDYMERDGADYSQEVYLAYKNLDEKQMNRLFNEGVYGGPDSLQEFVESEGYDSIDEWANAERTQLLLEHELAEKQSELDAMTGELEENARGELKGTLGDYNGK